MIEAEILENLFEFTLSKEPGIIYHTVWLFSNLLENEELCHIIIKTIPEFLNRINLLLTNYSNSYQFQDIYYILCWLVYRIFVHTGDYYVESFYVAIPNFLKVLEIEVNNYILKLDIGFKATNVETENNLINTIFLLFDKFTRYIEDTEILRKLIHSNLIPSVMKLLSVDLEKILSDDLFLIFRVVGGLLSTNNDADVDYLLDNYNFLDKVEKIIKNLAYSNYPNIPNPKRIIKEMAWCLSNVTGGTKAQIGKVLKTAIPSYLLNFTNKIKEPNYYKEVIFMFYNAFDYGSPDSKKAVLSDEVLNLISEAISNSNYTPEVVKIALDFLRLIISEVKSFFDINVYKNIKIKLERNNIPNILEKLQYNHYPGVGEVAEFILLDNWSVEEY